MCPSNTRAIRKPSWTFTVGQIESTHIRFLHNSTKVCRAKLITKAIDSSFMIPGSYTQRYLDRTLSLRNLQRSCISHAVQYSSRGPDPHVFTGDPVKHYYSTTSNIISARWVNYRQSFNQYIANQDARLRISLICLPWKIWDSLPGHKSVACHQRPGTAAMLLRSCVTQALNRGDGPCHLLHASAQYRECNEDLILI